VATTPHDRKKADAAASKVRKRQSREINRQLHPWTKRRVAAWTLFVLAFVIAVQHIFAHLGTRPIPIGMGLQDIVIGWPMAGLIGIAGLMILDPRPPPKDSQKGRGRHG